MSYDLIWYVDIICWESDILIIWLMINRQTYDLISTWSYIDVILKPIVHYFWWNSPAIQSIPLNI